MSDETMSASVDAQESGAEAPKSAKKLGFVPLVALIVGSSVGGGIFNATSGIAGSAPAGVALLTWLFVGAGILLLVLSINNIIKRTPQLVEQNPDQKEMLESGGLVGYAEAGFGKFWGLMSGWGYWLSAWLGNVAFAALLLSAFAGLSPTGNGGLVDGVMFAPDNIMPFMFVSLIMWFLVLLVSGGIESAAIINAIVLVAKFVPLLLVLIMGLVALKNGILQKGFWDNVFADDVMENTFNSAGWGAMSGGFMTMIWCFVGVEGACMFVDRAKNPKGVSKATNTGFIILLVVYILLSVLPYGVFTQEELADLDTPALAYILKETFGGSDAGLYIVNVGLILSLLGAWLSWTLLPVQTLEVMANQGHIPARFAEKNKAGVPMAGLILSTVCCQVFMLVFLFPNLAIGGEAPYDFFVFLCGNAILVTWFFAALYQVKIALSENNGAKVAINLLIGLLAAGFQVLMMLAVGGMLIMTMLITYIPAFVLYYYTRKKNVDAKIKQAGIDGVTLSEKDTKVISSIEWVFMAIISVVAIVSVILVTTGTIDIYWVL